MIDLVETFADARFGKQAVAQPEELLAASPLQQISAYLTMPKLTPARRELRDELEQSVGEEKRLKQRAGKAVEYARYRRGKAHSAGKLGWLIDILRAAVPGLSPASAADGGIEKEGTDPEKPTSGGAFNIAHALAGVGGAGAGGLAGAGMLGGLPGAARLEEMVGKNLTSELLGRTSLDESLKALMASAAKGGDIALAAQKDVPYLTRLTEKFSPKWWGKRISDPTMPRTAEAARAGIRSAVEKKLAERTVAATAAKQEASELLARLHAGSGGSAKALAAARKQLSQAEAILASQGVAKQKVNKVLSQLGRHGEKAYSLARGAKRVTAGTAGKAFKLRGKGKLGALIGAIVAMSPFMLTRLFKSRRLRAKGGTTAETAAEKAREALAQASKLKSWREKQLSRLAGAGGPTQPSLLPST